VVEYANRNGAPQWTAPPDTAWDYTIFGQKAGHKLGTSEDFPNPRARRALVFRKKFAGNRWVDHWTINGKSFPKTDPIHVRANSRYRLRFR